MHRRCVYGMLRFADISLYACMLLCVPARSLGCGWLVSTVVGCVSAMVKCCKILGCSMLTPHVLTNDISIRFVLIDQVVSEMGHFMTNKDLCETYYLGGGPKIL